MRPRYFVLEGMETRPVDSLEEWARLFEIENRQVARTHIGAVVVSTVFLGIDHNYLSGPPLLFESMIFGGERHGEQRRYSTWEEAEDGHAEMVALLRTVH